MRLFDWRGQWSDTVVDLLVDAATLEITHCVCAGSATSGRPQRYAVPWASVALERAADGGVEARVRTAVAPTPLPLDTAAIPLRVAATRPGGGRSPADSGADTPPRAQAPRRLRRLLGAIVVDAARRRLGRVEDLVVDCEGSKVAHVLVAFGGIVGLGTRRALVPADGMGAHAYTPEIVLPLTPGRLARMALPGPPHMADASWLETACARLETPAARRALGHVAATAASADASCDERARTEHGFNSLEECVQGTVVAMESSSRQRKGPPRQRVRLRMASGREATVLLAVLDDIAQSRFAIGVGQIATVRGWWAGQGPQSILIARVVTIDGRTLAIAEVPRGEVWMPQ
jgi:hypothetical protein